MKRVLIFSLTYHPYVGGAEVAIKEITDRLDPNEYEFHMITLRFNSALPKVEKVGNILVHRIGFATHNPKVSDRAMPLKLKVAKLLFPFTSLWHAYQLNRTYGYDAVWAMMANYAGFGALFFKLIHGRTPLLLELQDGRAFADMPKRQPILWLFWPLYKRLYLKADMIKTISHFIEREVRAIRYESPVVVIPNAVDVARFSAAVPEDELIELKEKYGKRMGDVFLFTASRLVLSRGIEDTIRALGFLPQNVKLLIAGTGEDQEKLERIAKESNVEGRVMFAGHVDHKHLPAYYKLSDIFVRPSIIEGFGNAFVEAFAAGIPVVATPVGGIPDFLFDPDANPDMEPTGIFCKVHDTASIARAVEQYMQNAALVSRVVRNAKELVKEKYDWAIITEAMKKRVFEPLVARHHPLL